MYKKSILIFGGGINQLTLIEACNSLGYRSIVIDPSINALGKKIANVYRAAESKDYDLTRKIALEYSVDGIATSQMENPLEIMAKLAEELNLEFLKPDIVKKSTDKWLMKNSFLENGVPCANGYIINTKEEFFKVLGDHLSYPVIIKPINSHSSRGVFRLDSDEEFISNIDDTKFYSLNGHFIVEEFIEGPEYSVETVTHDHITSIVQYTEKIITPFPSVVEIGHIQPAYLTDIQKHSVDKIVRKAIHVLGINNTVSHVELKLTNRGPVIIEVGPRMGGDFISSYLTKYSCGVDLDKATIHLSLGKKPNLIHNINKFSYVHYISGNAGETVNEISDYSFLNKVSDVIFAHIFLKYNDIISELKHSGNRIAVVIVTGNSRVDVVKKADYYASLLINCIKTK